MTTLIHERVEAARAGTNPTVVSRVASTPSSGGPRQLQGGCAARLLTI
jgi:hypothetical protein